MLEEQHIVVTREKLIRQLLKTIKLADMIRRCDEIVDLVLKKNHDYGDAWQKYGIFTSLIRLNDKLLRVKTLTDGEKALVASEGLKDTLRDTIGYCLLALAYIEENDQEQPSQPNE